MSCHGRGADGLHRFFQFSPLPRVQSASTIVGVLRVASAGAAAGGVHAPMIQSVRIGLPYCRRSPHRVGTRAGERVEQLCRRAPQQRFVDLTGLDFHAGGSMPHGLMSLAIEHVDHERSFDEIFLFVLLEPAWPFRSRMGHGHRALYLALAAATPNLHDEVAALRVL